jgi:hypothetical protein
MNPKLQLISLNLTNIVDTDSEVNLLSSQLGSNNSAFDTYYKIDFLNIFPFVKFQLNYSLNGVPVSYQVNGGSSVLNISLLMTFLNSGLGAYAFFSYELSTTPSYYTLIIKILDLNFVPVQFIEDYGA